MDFKEERTQILTAALENIGKNQARLEQRAKHVMGIEQPCMCRERVTRACWRGDPEGAASASMPFGNENPPLAQVFSFKKIIRNSVF